MPQTSEFDRGGQQVSVTIKPFEDRVLVASLEVERRDKNAVLERLDRDRHLLTSTVEFA